ncbi:MAG: DUF3107 domain-containing protein [Mobilicoccus sp.]|nr:DUF3107 domain-containing protein [Mobilicoccus sp.]
MEVKIGVQNTSREITLESDQSPEDVEAAVRSALESASQAGTLRLEDSKGSVVIVPAASLAYVEIGAARKGGVGFGMQ